MKFITTAQIRDRMPQILILLMEDIATNGQNGGRSNESIASEAIRGLDRDDEVTLHSGATEMIDNKRILMGLEMRSATISIAGSMMKEHESWMRKHGILSEEEMNERFGDE